MKRIAIGIILSLSTVAARLVVRGTDAPADDAQSSVECRRERIGGARYRVCELTPAGVARLELVARDGRGRPLGTIARADSVLRARGERLLFATNAGLYHTADSTTGMLVADGGLLYARLNRSAGPLNPCSVANFYCPPNGVFFVADDRAGVLSTEDFARRPAFAAAVRLASQSGPMLVRRGELARAFPPAGASRLIRNGVGVRKDGSVVFAISDEGVNFHQFATAFRDGLRCPDALFLDGTISKLYTGSGAVPAQSRPFAAMFVVTQPSTR
ncbi:phosphodiester glycosidase family protein [Longimicrobium sp.]|uniref:phosphodiester glycosidase family protein n=1 Tax=Longimicrobium sp. TaxID=2029185 RepID=UPI002E30C90F|nr:phosphodiester glycosidase family protein [Longimicrobium sp.]HEX6040483.1 phosphodiester glycosidase family protein [Longimicrobium sp.]